MKAKLVADKSKIGGNLVAVKMSGNSYHHGNLRDALLEEASRVLEEEGADAISLRALARTVGVSHAAPGHHFGTRNELMSELAADGYRRLADGMAASMERTRPQVWLEAVGKAYIRFGLSNPERYRLMFTSRLMVEDCPDQLLEESTRAYLILLTAAHRVEPDLARAPEYKMQIEELSAWSVVHGMVMLWLDGQMGRGVDSSDELIALGDAVIGELFG